MSVSGGSETGRQRLDPGAEPVARVAGDLLDRALAGEGEESMRAAVDFGSSTRSATSVHRTGPSVNAGTSTANARSMDWTLDTASPVG